MNAMVDTMVPIGAGTDHPSARRAIDRWQELKTDRSRHERDWEDIARYIRPQRGGFNLSDPGERMMEKPLSSEPIQAASSFASGLYANLTNPATRWFGLQTPDEDFNKWQPMAEWNDAATRRTFNSFGPSLSGFYPATFQAYSDVAAFGNAAAYDEFDPVARRFIDVTLSLAEVVCDVDAWGRVWEWVRKFTLTPRQAVDRFRGQGELPPKIYELAERGDNGKHVFYQHILSNTDWRPGRIGPKGKPWTSLTVTETECWLVRESGYDEMPAYFPRWDVDSGQICGTGPGFIALASARAVHMMEAAEIRALQFAADPTLLAPTREDWPLNGRIRPGVVVQGGLNIRGEQMVRPLQTGSGISLTHQAKAQKVEEIKNAFHYALMSLQGRTGVTVQESMIMEEARTREWAPHSDRIMEEYAARKVERRFRMLWRMGQLPPPPKEAAGLPLQIRYTSAAQMAMQAREGQAIVQFLSNIAPLAQTNPRYLDRLDPDATMEALHEASPSLPARILRSREAADELAKARAQQNQMAQMAQMAQPVAGAMKDAAAAQQMMQDQRGGQ